VADPTDLTPPLTPAKLGRAVSVIVERAIPSPRQESCMAVGQMERELTALCGGAVQLAYDDAAGIAKDARDRLARHLFIAATGGGQLAAHEWDGNTISEYTRNHWLGCADAALAVITGQEN